MKLQISFDMTDMHQALDIAAQVADYADIIEIGTLLVYLYGVHVIEKFKERFPEKTLFVDTKLVDRSKDVIIAFSKAGADWMTVMAGTGKDVIHTACTTASSLNKKIMLDLLDSSSLGQSALEAKNLGAHALLFHRPYDEEESLVFLDKWEMIKGNTTLPIFVSAHIKRETVQDIISLKPAGLVIGKSITDAEDPAEEARFYAELCGKTN